MVIIRESPRARASPSKTQAQWPPASPFEALMSSPGGRKRWEDIQSSRRERSESPSSRGRTVDGSSTLEDVETLQLELQILEKKKQLLDLAKKKRDRGDLILQSENTPVSSSPSKRRKLLNSQQERVHVPLSPSKPLSITSEPPVSPLRARLGLTVARPQATSLKRPAPIPKTTVTPEVRPVSSFSARLANARSTLLDKQQKSERLDSIRSRTFAQISAKDGVGTPAYASSRSLQNVMSSISRPSAPTPRTSATSETLSVDHEPPTLKKKRGKAALDVEYYDSFSDIHLTERKMSHTDVAKSLTGCTVYTLPLLLKQVKSPEYEPPDCDTDYVVLAVLAEKSSPFQQRETNKVHDSRSHEDGTRMAKNKFMVLRLCDLKWELDCYLFGTGFEQYWKLTEGSLIAILNPAIMPPKTNQHNGRFSLKVTSSEDRIIEIGTARDLGYCASIKKDGKKCSQWVNKKKSAHCEFHLNMQIGRARKGRMEVNTMWRGKSPPPKPKGNANVKNTFEYGQIWSAGNILGASAARCLDADDTDALSKLTAGELSRKRIAATQREKDLQKQLGSITAGVAGDYFRSKYDMGDNPAYSTPDQPMFVKPTAGELGLLNRKADDQRLSPAKDRRRHFGLGAVSSAGKDALGWGGARKAGLLQPRESRLGSPEKGQQTLAVTKTKGVLQSPTRDRSLSPSKEARFKLDQGIRRPGRESGRQELFSNDAYDDDDDLDIV